MLTLVRPYVARASWHLRSRPWWRSDPPRRIKDLLPRQPLPPLPVALTFDDGPDPRFTPALLTTLSDLGVRATFFMCGLAAERHPDLVRAVADEGHTIGGHTWHHLDLRGLSDEDWDLEVHGTHRSLSALTGRPIRYFRPPWGHYDRATLHRLRQAGLTTVLFSATGADWSATDPADIAHRVVEGLQPGAIVLLHDGCGDLLAPGGRLPAGTHADRSATIAALPSIVDAARAAGLRLSPIGAPSR